MTNSAGHGLVYDKPRSSGQTMTTDPRPGMSWSSMSCTWGPSRPPAPHRHRRWSLDGTWGGGQRWPGSRSWWAHFIGLAVVWEQPFLHWLGASILLCGATGLGLAVAASSQSAIDAAGGVLPGALLLAFNYDF